MGTLSSSRLDSELVGQISVAFASQLEQSSAQTSQILAVEDVDDIFSSAQAEQILKKFFAGHKVESFEIKHSGKSKLNIQYRIGDLVTTSGDEYRVTFNMKEVSGKYARKFGIFLDS